MIQRSLALSLAGLALALASGTSAAADHGTLSEHAAAGGPACEGFGPQTPRDIDNHTGENARTFAMAPPASEMNLCNIHLHVNAEHKAAAFSIYAGEGEHGHGGGYQCNESQHLSAAELAMPEVNHCEGVKPGDTIEVHWVFTSCDVKPGKGLGSCLSESCANPNLRVESQVFTVVNDPNALDYTSLMYDGHMANGYYQPKALPTGTGNPVEFLGSTTGPSYTEQTCSPMQVTWSVRPECAKVDINSLSKWCEGNVFEENHAHGVRQLVTNPKLLAPME